MQFNGGVYDGDIWRQKFRDGSHCLLYLFDQLILCLKHKSLPSYFISQCNLLEGIKRTSDFQMIVERVRSKPLKYAMEFLTSIETFELGRYNDYITAAYIDILNKSSFQSAAAYIISNTDSEKDPKLHPNLCFVTATNAIVKLKSVKKQQICFMRTKDNFYKHFSKTLTTLEL